MTAFYQTLIIGQNRRKSILS